MQAPKQWVTIKKPKNTNITPPLTQPKIQSPTVQISTKQDDSFQVITVKAKKINRYNYVKVDSNVIPSSEAAMSTTKKNNLIKTNNHSTTHLSQNNRSFFTSKQTVVNNTQHGGDTQVPFTSFK